MSKTAILILNWNGSEDTLSCLRSLLPHLGAEDYLFLIDNGSTDNSVKILKEYFGSEKKSLITVTAAGLKASFNAREKNYLVCNQDNLGFGAGNNVVLKTLRLLDGDFEFAWLLNNDTIVNAESLSSLRKSITDKENIGAAGSLLLNYPDNGTIQCSGVKHYKFFGVSKLINKNKSYKELNKELPITFDYLNGASLLFRVKALEKSGYFDERFFLYSEELDLELRLQEQNYSLHLDLNSTVYHKLGGATSRSKYLFFYYYNTSAVLLSRKHFSFFYTCCAVINLTTITLIRTFPSLKSFRWGVKGIISGLRK